MASSDPYRLGHAVVHREILYDERMTDAMLRVYLALSSRTDGTGTAWPSVATIARDAGKGVTQTKVAIKALKDAGFIEVTARRYDSTHSRSNLYRLVPSSERREYPDGLLEDQEAAESEARPTPEPGTRPSAEPENRPSPGSENRRQNEHHLERTSVEEKETSSPSSSEALPPDAERLLTELEDLIESNGSKRPSRTKKNRDAARLLLARDKRPFGEAMELVRWCQRDSFWRSNILSMSKFREKYDRLRLKMLDENPGWTLPAEFAPTDRDGNPAPYGLSPNGRALGPKMGEGYHPRSHMLGPNLAAKGNGRFVTDLRTNVARVATAEERDILNGKDD